VEEFGAAGESSALTLTIAAPVPTITSLSPNSAGAGSAGFYMTIQGTGLISNSTAYWNGVAMTTGYSAGSTQTGAPASLFVSVPAALVATVGTATITVVNPGNPTPSNGIIFTIAPPITIASISPSAVTLGGPAFTITVNGSGFSPDAVVSGYLFAPPAGYNFATTFVSSSQLTAVVPAWATAAAGEVQIGVHSGGAYAAGPYLAVTGVTPVITNAQLLEYNPSGPSWEVVVDGSGFATGATVSWAGTPLTIETSGSQELVALLPNALVTVGAFGVTVTDPGGATSNVFTVDILPFISGITPSTAVAGSAALTISVTGWGFRSGSVAYLAGSGSPVALTTTFVSSTALSAVVPASFLAAAGTYNLTVLDTSGVRSTSLPFTVSPAPSIGSLSPATMAGGGANGLLTVNGSGFSYACVVEANGASLSTNYGSSSQMTATVPATVLANPGAVAITVVCSGVASNSVTLTITAAAPSVTSLSAYGLNAGGPAFTLTVTGANFVQGSVVQWNGAALATTYQNSGSLTAVVPAALTAIAGTANVTVANPGGSVSTNVAFQVNVVLSSVAPSSTPAGSPNLTITVTGAGFPPSAVLWLGSAGPELTTTYVNSTTLTAVIPAADLAQPSQTFVTVLVQGLSSPRVTFTITGTPVTIASLSPPTATAGGPAFTLTVNGSGFVSGATVEWNSTALATTFVSASQLTATVPAALIANTGSVSISVAVPAGTTSVSTALYVYGPVPTLSSLSPNSALPANPGFNLTVNGSQFYPGALVEWNQAALPTTFVSSTVLTATVDASLVAGAGPVSVFVMNYGNVRSNSLSFTLAGAATITSLSQTSAVAGSAAFSLTVNGTGFGSATGFSSVVEWNGTPLNTAVYSSVYLTAYVPASLLANAGSATITVATGSFVSNGIAFTITPATPTIANFVPASLNAGGPASSVSIYGTAFVPASVASWNGTPLATTFVSATNLSVSIPASLTPLCGSFNIVVTNPGGLASSPLAFSVDAVLTAVSPASLPVGTSDVTITVTGIGFQPGLVLGLVGTRDGTIVGPVLVTTFVNTTTLTAVIPGGWLVTPMSAVIKLSTGSQVPLPIGAPSIGSLDPPSVTAGTPSFTLTVNGAGFFGSPTVQWNGGNLTTTVVSTAKLTASIPGSLAANPGTAAITVFNNILSNSAAFTIAPPGGSISAISPSQATVGGPAFTLTVTGSGFATGSFVEWNGSNLATTFVNANQLTAAVPANLLAGPGTAAITVATGGQVSPSMTFTISASSQPAIDGIVNAASYQPSIAPGSLISIFGSHLAGSVAQAGGAPLPATLANTSVSINGVAAPLWYVGPGQINAQVPFETPIGTASLVVQSGALESAAVSFSVAATGPGVLNDSATGHAVAQNQAGYSLNSAASPASPGQYIIVYMTGQGLLDNPIATGAAAPADPLSRPLASVEATIGGQPAYIAFAGMTPGSVGLFQLNLQVPNVSAGEQPLTVTVGNAAANPTTVSVQ